jgi:5-methylcytosine-specific restriction endonuclease McrA
METQTNRQAYKKKWYHDNIEKMREYYRLRRQDPKIKEQRKAYAQANSERLNVSRRAWKHRNKNYVAEAQRQYRKNQPEKWREWGRLWRLANPISYKLAGHNRRVRKLNATGVCTPEQLIDRFNFYGNRCAYCRAETKLTVDHVIPLSRGGSNWPANLRPACDRCNKTKATRTLAEWSSS